MSKTRMNKLSRGINLLPSATKKIFARRYYLSFITILAVAFSIVAIVGSLLLVPSYLLARTEAESAERYLSALEETVGLRERTGVNEMMRKLSESVDILSSFEKSRPTAGILEAVDNALPPRVYLQGVGVTHAGSRKGEVLLVGVANTRTDLLAFSDALKENPLFQNISIPVNQLVPEFDVKFSFSFKFDQGTP